GVYVWQDISAGLPAGPVFSAIVHPSARNWLYAGTHAGLYRSTDDGQTWSAITIGPARVPISDLSWVDARRLTSSATDDFRLLVGTYGRGVFELDETPNPERVVPETISYSSGTQTGGHVENLLISDDRSLVSSASPFANTVTLELVGRSGFGRSFTFVKG